MNWCVAFSLLIIRKCEHTVIPSLETYTLCEKYRISHELCTRFCVALFSVGSLFLVDPCNYCSNILQGQVTASRSVMGSHQCQWIETAPSAETLKITSHNVTGKVNRWSRFGLKLQWRHNRHGGVSNHQPHQCLFNRLFERRSKKTSKLTVMAFVREFTGDRWIPRTNGQ